MRFAAKLPANCPPSSCVPTSGKVFRIVGKNPPREEDFKSFRELKPDEEFKDESKECEACGLSIYRDKSDVHRMIRRIPNRRKRIQIVAMGILNETMGVMVHTPKKKENSHHTWWMYFGCSAWEEFTVVEIIQPRST